MNDLQRQIVETIIEQDNCDGISCRGRFGWFKGTACPFLVFNDGDYCHCYKHAVKRAKTYLKKTSQ